MTGDDSVPVPEWPVAIVFAGGEPVARQVAGVVAGRRRGHRRRLRAARRGRARCPRRPARRRSRTRRIAPLVDAAIASGTTVERHPAEKDATDLELAFDAARARGARRIVLVDGGGDRLDHLLGNIALLASPALAGVQVEAYAGTARLAVARGGERPVAISGLPGSLVTLLAAGGRGAAESSPRVCATRCAAKTSRPVPRAV